MVKKIMQGRFANYGGFKRGRR